MNTLPRRLGKYELQEPLGRGGMAEVWRAMDTQLRRSVAIKLMHANLQADPDFVSRFMHEAQVIAALHHPNIVQIYDFYISEANTTQSTDADAIAYMVMEYIKGQTLANYIYSTSYRKEFPSADTVVRLFTPISFALDYAHQQGTIHRDIKPANILLDQQNTSRNPMGEPILSDFGLAKLLNAASQTMTGKVFGTPLYISPEQVQGKPATDRSDLYSLGVIFYEIFTGERPFQADSVTAIMLKQISEMPKAPHLVNPNLPAELSAVILKSLAKDPKDRYPSASALMLAIAESFAVTVPTELQQAVKITHGQETVVAGSSKPQQAGTADDRTIISGASYSPAVENFETMPTPVMQAETRRNPSSSPGVPQTLEERDKEFMSAETVASGAPAAPVVDVMLDTPAGTQRQGRVQGPISLPGANTSGNLAPAQSPPRPPDVSTAPSAPTPPARSRRRGVVVALIVVLICVLLGSGLTTFLIVNHNAAVANTLVGQAYFVSSGHINETTNQGANDEFQINLSNIPNPASGQSYYGWLLPDSDTSEMPRVLLGRLPVVNGGIHYLYTGDGQYTNLLTNNSRFLITEQGAGTMPDTPSLDQTTWKYYAALPNQVPAGQTYSLLDHLRHLLADDPDLQKLHIPGGLDIWTYRDIQKLQYWAQTALQGWKGHDYDTVHKRIVEMLDYLDGASMVQQDVPPGTPLLADPLPSQVPLLQLHANQQPPGYIYHDELHLNGVVSSPGATQGQHNLAIGINSDFTSLKAWLEKLRTQAIPLAAMSNDQLAQNHTRGLLNELLTVANDALNGGISPITHTQQHGMTQVYKEIQQLAAFDVTAYRKSS